MAKDRATTTVAEPLLIELALTDVNHEVIGLARFGESRPIPNEEFLPGYRDAVNKALAESALLHFRNLVDFLIGSRPRLNSRLDTDLVASHYFDDPGLYEPPASPLTADERSDMNRYLAHLTTHRAIRRCGEEPFSWDPILRRVPIVLQSFETFVEALRSVHPTRAAAFDAAIRRIHEPWGT